jgi:hypothetical protein
MLWPRPYPGFLPALFKNDSNTPFNINKVNMLEVLTGQDAVASKTYNLDIEWVTLKK